jgi:hypothetical protein
MYTIEFLEGTGVIVDCVFAGHDRARAIAEAKRIAAARCPTAPYKSLRVVDAKGKAVFSTADASPLA